MDLTSSGAILLKMLSLNRTVSVQLHPDMALQEPGWGLIQQNFTFGQAFLSATIFAASVYFISKGIGIHMTQKNLASVFESWLANYCDRLHSLLAPQERLQDSPAMRPETTQAESEA